MFVLLTGLVQRTWEERVRKICEPTAARFHYQELTPLLKCGQLSIHFGKIGQLLTNQRRVFMVTVL